jgi:hypothetical protein
MGTSLFIKTYISSKVKGFENGFWNR